MPIANAKARIITNAVSDGARLLGEALNAAGVDTSRVRASGGPKSPRRLNIKWGCFSLNPTDYGGNMLNAQAGETSLNKLSCFRALAAANVPVPEFTDSRAVAESWLAAGCRRIYERHNLRGSEGDGIRIVGEAGEPSISAAPLYVKGMHGIRREYRVHVFTLDGIRRVFVQQKRRRTTGRNPGENTDAGTIRNLANGWIFAHHDIVAPRADTINAAIAAVGALRLNFGAVDLIEMDAAAGGSVVLEVNCAPGLMGGTLDFYASAIRDYFGNVRDGQPTDLGNTDVGDDDTDDVDRV